MLEHDVDYAGEPPLHLAAIGLVWIDEALCDFFSGDPCDKRAPRAALASSGRWSTTSAAS
jgi:hypothetical protein